MKLPLNQTEKEQGVIVLAHGGSAQWNNAVLAASKDLADRFPTVVAFGMADPESVQEAIHALEALHVKKIVVVPLFVSSNSELYRQTEFILGLREHPDRDFVEGMKRAMEHPIQFIWKKITWENIPYALRSIRHHGSMRTDRQVFATVPLELRPALDGNKLVGEILAERAMNVSKNPSEETVLIVAHGPIRDDDDVLWLRHMETLAKSVREYHFHNVCVATMRDDAPDEVKDKALARMRDIVRQCTANGDRVIVVPLLLAKGGVEGEIRHILKGLPYAYDEDALLPHGNINRWLLRSAGAESMAHAVSPARGYEPSQLEFGTPVLAGDRILAREHGKEHAYHAS